MVVASQEIPGRRLKILRIANAAFVSMFLQGAVIESVKILKGLPNDAKIINVNMMEEKVIDYWIESEEFDPVPFGYAIPIMEPPIVAMI